MSHNPQIIQPYMGPDVGGKRFEQRLHALLDRITMPFPGWEFIIRVDRKTFFIRVYCPNDTCARTGNPYSWLGRSWLVEPEMNDSEILRTAFLAVRGAAEHELFEKFLIDGQRPFDPHLNMTNLSAFAGEQSNTENTEG